MDATTRRGLAPANAAIGETEGVHGCRTHRMHENVARVHELDQGGPALCRRDVDQPTALAPPQRRPTGKLAEGGTSRFLHHVDVRPEVGEELRDSGTTFGAGKFDDPQTL